MKKEKQAGLIPLYTALRRNNKLQEINCWKCEYLHIFYIQHNTDFKKLACESESKTRFQ